MRPKPRFKSSKSGTESSGWLPFLAGLAMGLFVALLVYLQGYCPAGHDSRIEIEREEQSQKVVSQNPDSSAAEMKPRFDFYTLLPQMEIKIPEGELATKTSNLDSETKRNTAREIAYILQVGSYQRFKEADRTKARLALIGIPSDIHKVMLDGKGPWYRVRIGPIKDPAKLETTRNRLIEHNMKFILLPLKPAKP